MICQLLMAREVFLFAVVLNASVILFIYVIAFPIGVYSATNQDIGEHHVTFIGFIGLATPNSSCFNSDVSKKIFWYLNGRVDDGV